MKKIISFIVLSLFFFNLGAQTTSGGNSTKVSSIAIKSAPVANVLPSNNAVSLRNQIVRDTNADTYFIDLVGSASLIDVRRELNTITDLQNYKGKSQTIIVIDSLRGGTFKLRTATGNTVENINIYASNIVGYVWKRDFKGATKTSWSGAINDTTINSFTQIQNVLNNYNDVIIDGNYGINDSLIVKSNQSIKGENGAIIKALSYKPVFYIVAKSVITISNLKIVGTGNTTGLRSCIMTGISNTMPFDVYRSGGISAHNSKNITVSNCIIENFLFTSVAFYTVNGLSVINNTFRGGVPLHFSSTDLKIEGAAGNPSQTVNEVKNVQIIGNRFNSNFCAGFSIGVEGSTHEDVIVSNNISKPVDLNGELLNPLDTTFGRLKGFMFSYTNNRNANTKLTIGKLIASNNISVGNGVSGYYLQGNGTGGGGSINFTGNMADKNGLLHNTSIENTLSGDIVIGGQYYGCNISDCVLTNYRRTSVGGSILIVQNAGFSTPEINFSNIEIKNSQSYGIKTLGNASGLRFENVRIFDSKLNAVALQSADIVDTTKGFEFLNCVFNSDSMISNEIVYIFNTTSVGSVTRNIPFSFTNCTFKGTTTITKTGLYAAANIIETNNCKFTNLLKGVVFENVVNTGRFRIYNIGDNFTNCTDAYIVNELDAGDLFFIENAKYQNCTNTARRTSGTNYPFNVINYSTGFDRVLMWGTAAPTSLGFWKTGDRVMNTAPTAGGVLQWVCTTAGSAGSAGTWTAITAN
jgi:hypothetical protein